MRLASNRLGRFAPLLLAAALLTGRITDRTTGQPMPAVDVAVGSVHVKSDAGGRYTLRGLHAGNATIVVGSDDVPTQRFPVKIDGTTHRDLRVCSTTLDYHCGTDAAPAGNG